MLILHITRDYVPSHCGGISTAVHGLVGALLKKKIKSDVVSFDRWRPTLSSQGTPLVYESQDETTIVRLRFPAQLEEAEGWGRGRPAHCVLVHHEMLWDFGKAVADARGIPAVLAVHLLQSAMSRVRGITEVTMSLAAQQRAILEADWVVAPSKAVARELEEAHPGLTSRLSVAGLGFDDALGLSSEPEEPTVAFVGRFDSIKGLPVLLEAMELVVCRIPKVRLLLIGGNPGNSKSERRWKRRLENELSPNLQKNVLITGWLKHCDVRQHLSQASMVVMPSLYETFGLVALEAMGMGAPVVAARVGGLPELIQHEHTGILVDCFDPHVWARVMIDLLEDSNRSKQLGKNAQSWVLRHCTWDKKSQEWLAPLQSLLG